MEAITSDRSSSAIQLQAAVLGCFLLFPVLVCMHASFGFFQGNDFGHALGTDDAFISFRYARNFADGYGLVFNPGSYVEGYSNLLYTLVLSLASRYFNGQSIYLFSVWLNTILFECCLYLLFHILRRLYSEWYSVFGILLFILFPPCWAWAGSGMETILVLLINLCFWDWVIVQTSFERSKSGSRLIYLLAFASVLSRVDGFITPLVAAFYLVVQKKWCQAIRAFTSCMLAVVAVTLWRVCYYGYAVPNTYYAKVSGPVFQRLHDGLSMLVSIALQTGYAPYLMVLAFCSINLMRAPEKSGPRGFVYTFFFCAAWLSYYIYIGGDVFYDRFLLALIPMLIVSTIDIIQKAPRIRRAVLAALLTFYPICSSFLFDHRFHYVERKPDRWVEVGKFLGEHYSRKTIAVDAAGKIPFFSGLITIDMLGLNDPNIGHMPSAGFKVGHSKYDPTYILQNSPDLIAAWINGNLDVHYGLTRALYRDAGYKLTYLCSKQPIDGKIEIIDVSSLPSTIQQEMITRGYKYAILSKEHEI